MTHAITRALQAAPQRGATSAQRLQRQCACGSHTPGGGTCAACGKRQLQAGLTVGATDDALELEADRVAEQVTSGAGAVVRHSAAPRIARNAGAVQAGGQPAPASVEHVLAGAGSALERPVLQDMGRRFGHDFSQVRVHADASAAQSARDVQAHAYTVGRHVVFGAGQFAPASGPGRRLLAHELTHVVQQGGHLANSPGAAGVLARAPAPAPVIGSKFVPPAGKANAHADVKAHFDGQDFIVTDGTTVVMRHAAQSGKPISVRSGDAAQCGGASLDSYLNNARYLGIQDFGAIPEGEFSLKLAEFSTFSALEQAQMITGGMYVDPFGAALHGGDWGAGRAPLHPKKLLPASSHCGDTKRRSGFYLHGGSLPGSSGCIDVDNSGINTFLGELGNYKPAIPVTVRYTHPAPAVGAGTRGLGRFTYPTKDGKPIKDPSIWDRFKSIGGSDDAPPPAQPKAEPKAAPKPSKKPRAKRRHRGARSDAGSLAPDAGQFAANALAGDDLADLDDESGVA